MRYLAPIARCRILAGDKEQEYLTGDRLLKSVKVTLSEDQRASTCSFEVYDPELLTANDFFEISFSQGGIQVPPDLLEDPNAAKAASSGGTPSGTGGSSTSVADASQTPEIKAWLDTIAWAEGADYNVMFTGRTFSGFGDHPRQVQSGNGLASDAAGRYQFLSTTWDDYCSDLDFSPESQDKCAVRLLDQKRNALAEAQQGEAGVDAVLEKISFEWASLPPYRYPGQGTKTTEQVKQYYRQMLAKYQGTNVPQSPPAQAAAAQPAIADAAKSKPAEVSNKGTEIIVELGYSIDQLIAYHFIHVGTRASRFSTDTCVFEGQSIRWLMTRRTKNTAFENVTLKEIAEQVATSYGFELEMEGDGPTYQHLDQTGITDYELLLREARAIGYSIREENNKLILKPYRPNFTGFVITSDILISITFTDRASKDRQGGKKTSEPAKPAADNKAKIDRLSGQAVQTKEEDTTAAALQNNIIIEAFDLAFGTDEAALNATAAVLTGSDKKPVGGTPSPGSAKKIEGIQSTDDPVTGLPKQEIGAIDLADGKAEAQVIKDESRRVKGYESQAEVITTPEVLTIAPGSVIGISRNIVPEVFAREWRVGEITHNLTGGRFTSTIQFYSPQAAKPPGTGTGSGGSVTTNPTSTLNSAASSQGWAEPMQLAGNSSCGATCEFGYARGRLHEGIDYGGYGSGSDPDGVFAASDGTVTYADWMGGYGRTVDIKRSDDWSSRYAHLASMDVSVGDQVKQGQRVGTRGGSGFGENNAYEIHLHFEIRRPDGSPIDPRSVLPKPGLQMAG